LKIEILAGCIYWSLKPVIFTPGGSVKDWPAVIVTAVLAFRS